MIYDLQSAKEFMEQCKYPFELNIPDTEKVIVCFAGDSKSPLKFEVFQQVDEYTCKEEKTYTNACAIRQCYFYRKHINAYFNN